MASTSKAQTNIVTLDYGTKEWFKVICGLNDSSLIPGQDISEKNISKQDCEDAFGPPTRGNNGYTVGKDSPYRDRVVWLWKRVHQAEKPPNNCIGQVFCQAFLYEVHHGINTVNWAQFAVNTVNWFQNSRGQSKVFKYWAYASPSITIDMSTGASLDGVHPPMPDNEPIPLVIKVPASSSKGDVKKRRVNNSMFEPNNPETVAIKIGPHLVKLESIPVHVTIPQAKMSSPLEIPMSSDPNENLPNSGCVATPKPQYPKGKTGFAEMPSWCNPTSDIPSQEPQNPKTSTIFEEFPSGCTPTPEIPSEQVHPTKKSAESKEVPSQCSPNFLNAIQLFRVDFERAMTVNIKELEEQKGRLETVLEQTRHELSVATSTIKLLMEDLQGAKMVLADVDTNENRGEVRCIEFAIKSAQNKLNLKKAKYEKVSREWRLQVKLLTEKHQAQKVLEAHFRLKDEEDQPFTL